MNAYYFVQDLTDTVGIHPTVAEEFTDMSVCLRSSTNVRSHIWKENLIFNSYYYLFLHGKKWFELNKGGPHRQLKLVTGSKCIHLPGYIIDVEDYC